MGEVVVNAGDSRRMDFSREAKEIEMESNTNNNTRNDATGTGTSMAAANSSAVRFESFLPKMTLRVLLVEADDSTRQIIVALLRKCNYRVAAVSDGLKAWEALKRRPQNIDLILTEVDLPSISGFALLTLIMEHRVCKNIPVIMMSSEDSVSTVYKCMLRGAADFLVKPVRKNELRNLWQHVWRRQSSSSREIGPPDDSIAPQMVEATAENNNMSNCSSDDMACIQKSREGLEKGSDAQSSCTKPELEAEAAELECAQGLSHPKWSKPSSGKSIPTNIGYCNLTNEVQDYHVAAKGSRATAGILADRNFEEDSKLDDDWMCFNAPSQACRDSHMIRHSSREAIDLIGAFDNPLKFMKGSSSSNAGKNNFDSLALLDLSLRRSLPCSSVNQVTDERPRLNHSDASAFSRYINKSPRPGHSASPITCNRPDNQEANSDKQFSNQTVNCNSYPCGLAVTSPRSTPLASGQHGEIEKRVSSPNCRMLPSPVPVRGFRFENVSGAFGSSVPPALYTRSSMSQIHSIAAVNHQEGSFQVSFNSVNHLIGDPQPSRNAGSQNADDANDQSENVDMKRLESTEDRGNLSSATEQSANNAFCNGTVTFPNLSLGSKFEEASRANDGSSIRSLQREAALTKFRLKRKERCFEKKVRYESRKKLADKRPRIKGQFIRQVSNETPSGKSSGL